jgi:hypothetical protein
VRPESCSTILFRTNPKDCVIHHTTIEPHLISKRLVELGEGKEADEEEVQGEWMATGQIATIHSLIITIRLDAL